MGWRTAIDAVAFAVQDLGAKLNRAGHRLEHWNAPRHRVLGFKASTWEDHKVTRHIILDSNYLTALCGMRGGPFGWENLNHIYDRDLWPHGICPNCLAKFKEPP